jgi:DNA-binding transcriptional MerR regulator
MDATTKNMLRAGQLAKLAGVSLPTIKHYVNEGLIPTPVKTGKTMAYYDESCVERIKQIKKLQKERFLPLDVIKRVLDSGDMSEQEIELGQAILKSYKTPADMPLVSEAKIERRTGYSLGNIQLLEKEHLIFPTVKDGTKHYDSVDCGIIEIVKRREELGLPLDHSIETIRLYRDAIKTAVQGDIRLFAKNLLGDASTMQTIKLLTEVDDTLDQFMLLFRQKVLSSLSQVALTQMNELPARLNMLSFLPLEGAELPAAPPDDPDFRIIYMLLTGAYDMIINDLEKMPRTDCHRSNIAVNIIACLLSGDSETALQLTEQSIPKPSALMLDNAAAGLAYMFSIGEATGFSDPMYLAKKGLRYFKKIEASRRSGGFAELLARYICGSVYTMLPDIFDTCETGIRMLRRIDESLANRKAAKGELPAWLANTIDREIAPAIEVRVNRFLAEAFIKLEKDAEAKDHLRRLVEIADVDDEHAAWARLKKLETEGSATS